MPDRYVVQQRPHHCLTAGLDDKRCIKGRVADLNILHPKRLPYIGQETGAIESKTKSVPVDVGSTQPGIYCGAIPRGYGIGVERHNPLSMLRLDPAGLKQSA